MKSASRPLFSPLPVDSQLRTAGASLRPAASLAAERSNPGVGGVLFDTGTSATNVRRSALAVDRFNPGGGGVFFDTGAFATDVRRSAMRMMVSMPVGSSPQSPTNSVRRCATKMLTYSGGYVYGATARRLAGRAAAAMVTGEGPRWCCGGCRGREAQAALAAVEGLRWCGEVCCGG